MIFSQSFLTSWARCPLSAKKRYADNQPGIQTSSQTFGVIMHDCVRFLEENRSLDDAVRRFDTFWDSPSWLSEGLRIQHWDRGQDKKKLRDRGHTMLEGWWEVAMFDTDTVLAREYQFEVLIAGHTLVGTLDKLVYRKPDLVIVDYKTGNLPDVGGLIHDLQYTVYCFASTQASFWDGIEDGAIWFKGLRKELRRGEYVYLRKARVIDAGVRTTGDYDLLRGMITSIARSVEAGIYTPNTGAQCAMCDFRSQCYPTKLALDQHPKRNTLSLRQI